VAIIGGGSWGTALGAHLARSGNAVVLWAREPEVVEGIGAQRRNPWYLPDIELPAALAATREPAEAVRDADVVIVVVPSEFFASTLKDIPVLPHGVPVVSATKGFDPARHVRMTELLGERFPGAQIAALSGPTFAAEVGRGLPSAAVIAATGEQLSRQLQQWLASRELRLYTNRDVVGVETGGAVKNVIAVATGMADGLGLGQNARAALITRGLVEMTRLAVALGGSPGTLAGLAGLGDLVLTCTGTLSRNHALGVAVARGATVSEVERGTRMIAEGVPTVRSVLALARRHNVTLPIAAEVAAVLFDGKSPRDGLEALLGRPWARED
jgi:glycerol-3-phosphate dehydrogenase (NAD(P)+)